MNMKGLLKLLDGWKAVIGYALMTVPWLTPYPMLKSAVDALLATPNKENLTNAIVQLILAIGIVDRVRKNLVGKK